MALKIELGDKDGKVELIISSNNWYSSLTRNMYTLMNSNKLCDTEIETKDGKVIYAHSVVMAGACDLLSNTFNAAVASSTKGKFKIKTSEISYGVWKYLLEYMYLGKICLNLEELDSLKEAADSLDLGDLQKHCTDASDIQKNMGADKQKVKAVNQVDEGTEIEANIMKFAAGINETLELVMDGASNVQVSQNPNSSALPEVGKMVKTEADDDTSKPMYLLLNESGNQNTVGDYTDSVEMAATSASLSEVTNAVTQTATEEVQQSTETDSLLNMDDEEEEEGEEGTVQPAASYSVHGRGRRRLGGSKATVFKCGICEKLYSSKQSLERHAVLHSGVKPFTCELCGKSFQTDRYLSAHLQRHNDDRNYQCPICGKSFKTQRDANWHKNSVHSILRRYQCRYCPYTAKTRALLNQHTFSHTNPKEWVCKTCGKAFLRKQHLEQHATRHEGKRQYMCSTCGAEFYTIYSCKEHHMRVHQGIKRYECSVCHQQYNEKKSFMKHLQKHSVDLVLKLDGGDIIIEQTVEEAVFNESTSDS